MAMPARPSPLSLPLPPKNVLYKSAEPVELSFVTKASAWLKPPYINDWSYAPAVVGKSVELVNPITYALPLPSMAMASPQSFQPLPPKNVLYKSAVPVELSFVTKPSVSPPLNDWSYAPAVVGKSVDTVCPVTYAFPLP